MATLQHYTPQGRHRLDLSYTRIDAVEGDLDLLLFGYTGAAWPNIRLGITAGVAWFESHEDPGAGSTGKIDESGLSDTQVTFQYDPTDRLTVSPWVPDTVGLNAALIMPTGDADKGLGGDAWQASLGAGWVVDFVADLWLIPSAGYAFTFSEGSRAVPIERAYIECSIIWLFPFGGWIGYVPSLAREFETDDWADSHTLTLGKMWSNGLGLSVDIGKSDRTERVPTRDDRNWLVNAYYQF